MVIYVNDTNLNNLQPNNSIKIGDSWYHRKLNKLVKINEINDNICDYYRGIESFLIIIYLFKM